MPVTPTPTVVRRAAVAAVAAVTAVALGGCSLGPGDSPPTGIDGLEVPSAAPDPDDFVAPEGTPGPEVAGVATTRVERLDGLEQVVDLLATDEDGHTWWFGREGEWQVGPDVPLGLWLPAQPRVGDGWRRSAAEGVSEDRVTVLETGEQVVLEVRSDLDPDLVRREVWPQPTTG